MKAITPYVEFDGTARDAMTFYAKQLGADLDIPSFANANTPVPQAAPGRILHARLSKDGASLIAGDSMSNAPHQPGRFLVCVECDDVPEIERLFAAFSDGGSVIMPLENTFWGARFGMLTDRYGVSWMFNCTF
ncbi:MAG: VOC family protein [Gemmatimonadaceae bacterium]